MGLASSSRANSGATNAGYRLRAAVEVRVIAAQQVAWEQAESEGRYAARPNFEVVGECGHRLAVIPERDVETWRGRIEQQQRHRKRCQDCPR